MTLPILKYDRFFTGRGGAAGGLSKVAEGDALRVQHIFVARNRSDYLGPSFLIRPHFWKGGT